MESLQLEDGRSLEFCRSGNDSMRGGEGDDRLVGQAGGDVARGGPGHDTCRAEVKKGCE